MPKQANATLNSSMFSWKKGPADREVMKFKEGT
jgi:hypothetical protein